jgi:hypothetical protein
VASSSADEYVPCAWACRSGRWRNSRRLCACRRRRTASEREPCVGAWVARTSRVLLAGVQILPSRSWGRWRCGLEFRRPFLPTDGAVSIARFRPVVCCRPRQRPGAAAPRRRPLRGVSKGNHGVECRQHPRRGSAAWSQVAHGAGRHGAVSKVGCRGAVDVGLRVDLFPVNAAGDVASRRGSHQRRGRRALRLRSGASAFFSSSRRGRSEGQGT